MIIPGILASSKTGRLWAPGQDYVSISTATVTTGGASSITFSSLPTTFKHLQIRFSILNATDVPVLQFNGDSTAGNYVQHNLTGNGTAASASAYTSARTSIKALTTGSNSTSPYVSIIDVLDYGSTVKHKTVRMLSGFDTNGGGEVSLISGLYFPSSIAAITSVSLVPAAGSFAVGSYASIYGVN